MLRLFQLRGVQVLWFASTQTRETSGLTRSCVGRSGSTNRTYQLEQLSKSRKSLLKKVSKYFLFTLKTHHFVQNKKLKVPIMLLWRGKHTQIFIVIGLLFNNALDTFLWKVILASGLWKPLWLMDWDRVCIPPDYDCVLIGKSSP